MLNWGFLGGGQDSKKFMLNSRFMCCLSPSFGVAMPGDSRCGYGSFVYA